MNRSNFKIGIVVSCHLKSVPAKEGKKIYFVLKMPIPSRLLEDQLFLGVCQINASEPVSSLKITYKHLACISLTLWVDLIREISTELLKNTSTY